MRSLTLFTAGVAVMFAAGLVRAEVPTKDQLPKLMKALSSKDPKARATAATGIGDLGAVRAADAEPAVDLMLDTMQDKDPTVRAAATTAIGKMDPEQSKAVKALKTAMHDKDTKVRAAAVRAIATVAPESPETMAAIKELKGKETDKGVLRAIKDAMKYLKPKKT
jgi:HEAT repeat protein